ncbi:MAG TPA: response regulator [Flavisolibacter sp.]|jgi:CheY-like chemotaxis protein
MKTMLKKILLVDDDADDCFFFGEQLKEIEPSLKLVCLNETKHLLLHASELNPDLIFLDIDMPGMDGFDCLVDLKKHPELKQIPVVMYSSSFLPKDMAKAYRLGASLYVSKPAGLAPIKATIKGIIELDWSQPEKITADHFNRDRYTSFRLPK